MKRGNYAELIRTPDSTGRDAEYDYGRKLIALAISQSKLADEYCDVDRKHRGSALNYDVYDVNIKKRLVLIQKRLTTCTKYGNSPKKDYFIISAYRNKIALVDINHKKGSIVKTAKCCMKPGELIDCIEGKIKINTSTMKVAENKTVYKAVVKNSDGRLISIYNSRIEYQIGETKSQKAKSNHGGGYYAYDTLEETKRYYPDASTYVYLECIANGRMISYENGKRSYDNLYIKGIVI